VDENYADAFYSFMKQQHAMACAKRWLHTIVCKGLLVSFGITFLQKVIYYM